MHSDLNCLSVIQFDVHGWDYGLDDGMVSDLWTTATNRGEGAAAYRAALAAL